ncbi:Amt family ammonium transporter [Ruminiclostridium sufflavum DSM 19573]|uniref:Amt family ammonium transporter n=1 Tax=Ruminiclostridium sufflavum DSM 19573 TaxID=1121337 RepID=A0A318XMF9_9FIRM|nr:ammonium transporter [Ruminiclostridium sufflavum]PYG89037.1 Amt family ammonium transporter [Ruminiclostridium sufflavum DSM 19573]
MFQAVDVIWTLVAAALVFFMQAGFAMLETGFTRAKNAGNIIMKNLMDFAIGSIAFWILGFGLMFGASQFGIIGAPSLFATGDGVNAGLPGPVFLIFQTVFCATAATIVSGAMAERTKFIAYCIYSLVISAVVYPISGHWIWGGGWLSQLGFHDFAGSTAVHMVGGITALIGAKMLGPRIGKYDKDGKVKAIPGHSLTLGALGVFILWFGWFGFNSGSTVSATGDDTLTMMGKIFITTNLAAAASATVAMTITWIRYKKPDVSMTLNAVLGGLVAITAGCDAVSPAGAAIIGVIAAFVVVFGIEFIDKVLKIDDPVGAVGVHGLCGAAGTLLVGIFALDGGLLYGGGLHYFGIQALGVISVAVLVTVLMLVVFTVIRKTVGLRVSKEEEIIGLDIEEHGLVSSYADFMPALTVSDGVEIPVHIDKAIPVIDKSARPADSEVKMTKVEIITKVTKFDALKEAMNDIGITGMTVSNVLGCGMQRGSREYYRGIEMEIKLLPKIRVEIVICKIPVSEVVNAAKRVLYTGKIGDGKIFIYNVENVIKVRTSEEGYDALQDDE